jgi:hypothetical protein
MFLSLIAYSLIKNRKKILFFDFGVFFYLKKIIFSVALLEGMSDDACFAWQFRRSV